MSCPEDESSMFPSVKKMLPSYQSTRRHAPKDRNVTTSGPCAVNLNQQQEEVKHKGLWILKHDRGYMEHVGAYMTG